MKSLAENLSKLQQYTKFKNSLSQTIPTAMSTQTPGSPTTGMTMEFRYDPTNQVSPATLSRSLIFKNQDADEAPDLTRELEAT
ncbi:hypothetical protein DPMN_178540 [Dreissena polymorpha]|uniref:Uncharacterized protein n=1 Tax=Dreissena polymorpha TaxID=45954 RepID=A0A9D4ED32_DREPO|nr:hypothetical protein DPMN_178540 [Dreissena polymorpha]